MVDIAPPASKTASSPTTQPVTNVTPVEATVSNVPDKILQLARQLQVNATVTQLPDNGTITLSTTLGNITLQLPQLVGTQEQKMLQNLLTLQQSQRPLTIIIQPGNPPTQAVLLLPSTQNAPLQNATNNSEPTLQIQPPLPVQQAPAQNTTLAAVVLPPNIAVPNNNTTTQQQVSTTPLSPNAVPTAPTNVAPPSSAENFSAESQQQQQPVTPPALTVPNPPGTPASILQPTTVPTLTTIPVTPVVQNVSALLQSGNELTLHVNAVLPASAPAPVLQAPNQVIATVTGIAPGGQLILKAGDATLFVRQVVDISIGTNLLVTVEAAKAEVALPLILPDKQNFNTLQQVFNNLSQINPQLAQQVLTNSIPQPSTPAFSGALLFLLSAFKQSDARSWLGSDAIDAIDKAGKFEIIGKLMRELNDAGQIARDSVVGEWHSYPIPVYNNQQFQLLSLYVHHDNQRQSDNDEITKRENSRVRFLIDVQFSKLGAVQLDGFVQVKKLDLIVRSEQHLPTGLHDQLRETYNRTLSGIDYAGSLNFQVGRHYWLTMQNTSPQTISM